MALKRWAWVGGAMGLMALAAFGVYAWRAQQAEIEPTWMGVGGAGLVLLLGWLWVDRLRLSEVLRSRAAQHSGTALLLTLVAAGIAVAANMLAAKHDHRWDLTSTGRYALSEQTISVAASLSQPIEVRTFFVGENPDLSTFKDLIEGISNHTDQLQVTHHDPILSPMLAEQYEITSPNGTVILQSGESRQRLEGDFDEEAMVNALIRLTSPSEHRICTATGHGELDPDGERLSGVVIQLERQNYSFTPTTLISEGGVPAGCEVLVVPDPEHDWLAPEREMLAAYVAEGGQVIVLLNPERAPELSGDLARYGVEVGRDIVLEANPNFRVMGGDASHIVLPAQTMADHPITRPIRTMAVMRMVRSVGKTATAIEGLESQELLHTSEYAWAETNLETTTAPKPDPGEDRIGKIPVATLVTVKDPGAVTVGPRTLASEGAVEPAIKRAEGGRVLVFGDADFTTNEMLGLGSNLDLLQNAIAWMVGEDKQVSIRPNEAARATLSMNEIQGLLLWFTTLLVLPGLCIGGAIATWLLRRRL